MVSIHSVNVENDDVVTQTNLICILPTYGQTEKNWMTVTWEVVRCRDDEACDNFVFCVCVCVCDEALKL